MKVLVVKPNEYAVEAEIENTLKAMQGVVGGHIEIYQPGKDPVVCVVNGEGKILGLEENRAVYDQRGNLQDILTGTFFVCGVKGDDFTSLSPTLMEKYKQRFYEPELFVEQGGKIRVIKAGGRDGHKKPIAERLAEGAEQAARDNAARQVDSARSAPAADDSREER